MLELHKLIDSVDAMSQEMARRQARYENLAKSARDRLETIPVDETLLEKIKKAKEDSTWRGAEPLEDSLDKRNRPEITLCEYSLVGVDGSQIYPDTHGPALYYLINTGSIILREGSGEAPLINTEPRLVFEESTLYDQRHNLIDSEWVNTQREMVEMQKLAELATLEREHQGGDRDYLVLAMKDGQLMLWQSQQTTEGTKQLDTFVGYLDEMRRASAIPVGFVGRPRSPYVVRLLWVAELDLEQITKERVDESPYRALTDRMLFSALLEPNQRSAIFLNTTAVNRDILQSRDQRVCFFYMNVARLSGKEAAQIVRIDLPEWVIEQPDLADRLQVAIYNDCAATLFPYVLVRADELAVVAQQEKRDFEQMVSAAVLRITGTLPESSAKAAQKELSRGYQS
ncbi:MAG: DNA double-strand break repair nuclease NurA [Chloroflexi bacterium]|nr:DNA double-strand break repair nuclease NurA [Chloroflexota bacterium]